MTIIKIVMRVEIGMRDCLRNDDIYYYGIRVRKDLYEVNRRKHVQVGRLIDNFVLVPICHSVQQLVASSLIYVFTLGELQVSEGPKLHSLPFTHDVSRTNTSESECGSTMSLWIRPA